MRLLGEWLDEQQTRFTIGLFGRTAQLFFAIDLGDRGKPAGLLVEARDSTALHDSLQYRRALLLTGRDGMNLRLQPTQDVAFSFELKSPQGVTRAAGSLLYAIADHMVTVIAGALASAPAGPHSQRIQR
jgi:hypothetical protein